MNEAPQNPTDDDIEELIRYVELLNQMEQDRKRLE